MELIRNIRVSRRWRDTAYDITRRSSKVRYTLHDHPVSMESICEHVLSIIRRTHADCNLSATMARSTLISIYNYITSENTKYVLGKTIGYSNEYRIQIYADRKEKTMKIHILNRFDSTHEYITFELSAIYGVLKMIFLIDVELRKIERSPRI